MRPVLIATLASLLASPAQAQLDNFSIPDGHEEAFQKAAMGLAFADGCAKAMDDDGFREGATTLMVYTLEDAGVDDPENLARQMAQIIRDAPQQKQEGPFTLFNPTMCGNVRDGIASQLAERGE